jgi:hypothetical protein
MFKQDLEVIDALRRDAVNVREPHTSGIRKIAAYAGQLSWMGGKFPIDVCLTQLFFFYGGKSSDTRPRCIRERGREGRPRRQWLLGGQRSIIHKTRLISRR